MIESFREGWLRAFFIDGETAKRIPADLERRLFRKLPLIDDTTTDADLRVPPSEHFEKLSGHLDGRHSIRVKQQWRLILRWNGSTGKAGDLHLDETFLPMREQAMIAATCKPVSAGTMLREEFMEPLGLTQAS